MEPKNAVKTDEKQRGRPFEKGKSGNPNGRPQGSRNKATIAIESLLDGQAEALTQKAIDLALDGDTTSLRICMDRLCPPRKSRPVNIELPEAKNAEEVAEAQAVVIRAVASGELTPEEGTTLSGILEARRKTIETQDHEARIAALEGKHKP